MASFLRKINRIRNVRMHMANETYVPHPAMYHEIVQGIPWAGGITRQRPKILETAVDKLLLYVVKKRPEYKNYPWCPDGGGVYIHPANWTSERMQQLIDTQFNMSVQRAFFIADKELTEKKKELDLQVTLAREHAARLGVANQGVDGIFRRAHKVYDSVFKMKEEEAVQTRRGAFASFCMQLKYDNERLSMQDLVDGLPFKDEQMQFFVDYPEYRSLFPPLWHMPNEVLEAQTRDTEDRIVNSEDYYTQEDFIIEESENTSNVGESAEEAKSASEQNAEEGKEEGVEEAKEEEDDTLELREEEEEEEELAEDDAIKTKMAFAERDPEGEGLQSWPPKYMFKLQERRAKEQVAKEEGAALEDRFLAAAREDLRAELEQELEEESEESEEPITLTKDQKDSIVEQRAKELFEASLPVNHLKDVLEERSISAADDLKLANKQFFDSYHQFIVSNQSSVAKDMPRFVYDSAQQTGSHEIRAQQERRTQSTGAQAVIDEYLQSGGKLDNAGIKALKETVRARFGEPAAASIFEHVGDGGATSLLQRFDIEYAEVDSRVNLTKNIELTPFYPENAFPPRGLLADPYIKLDDPKNIPTAFQDQHKELKEFGEKYAHAIEDFAPVKSKEYMAESVRWGTPVHFEHIPDPKPKEEDPSTWEQLSRDLSQHLTKQGEELPPNVAATKKEIMDQLAKHAFSSEAERRDYEMMLERRFDYIVAKRKELNEQWAQYWPSDKPETLIYRGPEVIREIFPEAYRLAVTRQFEKLTDLPLQEAIEVKSYTGLWAGVRARENRPTVKDLSEVDWQHQIDLNPSSYE